MLEKIKKFKWLLLVLLVLAILIPVFIHMISNPHNPIFNGFDRIYNYELGQECVCEFDKLCSVRFDSVYLARSIEGQAASNGGYLIFCGDIYTEHCYLNASDILLEASSLSSESDIPNFETELSIELSQAELNFQNERKTMDGKIALVFQVPESYCEHIEGKSNDFKIQLSPSISWAGGRCIFNFSTTDIFVTEEYSKNS